MQQVVAIIARSSGRPFTPTELFVFGVGLILFGVAGVIAVLTRWEWMQKHCGWMLRWGRGSWGFPATKLGVSFGGITGMYLGMMCVADSIKWFPFGDRDYMLIGLILWSLVGVCVALRDYFIHLNKKDE